MITLEEIKSAVKHLPQNEYRRFRNLFDKYESNQWDKKIEADVKSGKLDEIANNALNDYHSGK